MIRLFLDDIRMPHECGYMEARMGKKNAAQYKEQWIMVRNYDQFCHYLDHKPFPDLISFDHDLAHEHYVAFDKDTKDPVFTEKTGVDCARFLVQFCRERNIALPEYWVHSMNPVGCDNILRELKTKIIETTD